MYNQEGDTIIPLSEDIRYLGHDFFWRINGRKILMKEDSVYLDNGKIEHISDINDNGYAVF